MIYLLLFWEYFKIGLFTIGGGYAMLPMVTQVVQNHNWLTRAELLNFIGIAESTPGPFAINLATFVGLTAGKTTPLGLFGGFLGAIVATIGVILPSLIIIIIVVRIFDKFRTSRIVQGALYGIRPVVVGLILSALVSICCAEILPNLNFTSLSTQGFDKFNFVSLILIAAFFPLSRIKIKGKKIHSIFLIIFSAIVGIVLFGIFNLQA